MKKITILTVWLVLAISGCGGGSDVENILLPGDIEDAVVGSASSVNGSCENLLSVYEKIAKNMSPDQVKTAFGCSSFSQSEYNGIVTSLHYVNNGRGCNGYPYRDCEYEYVWIYFYDWSLVFDGLQSGATNKYYSSKYLTKQDAL